MQSFLIVAFPICSWKCFDVAKFLGYSHYNLCRDMLGWSNGARSHNLHNKLRKNPFTLQCRDAHDIVFWAFHLFAGAFSSLREPHSLGHLSLLVVSTKSSIRRTKVILLALVWEAGHVQMTSVTEILQYGASWVYLCLSVECIQEGLWRHLQGRLFLLNFGLEKEAKSRLSFWYPTSFLNNFNLSDSVYLKNHRHLFTLRFGNGVRIGEAKILDQQNLTWKTFVWHWSNPTTLLHRKEDLLQLNADAICFGRNKCYS